MPRKYRSRAIRHRLSFHNYIHCNKNLANVQALAGFFITEKHYSETRKGFIIKTPNAYIIIMINKESYIKEKES